LIIQVLNKKKKLTIDVFDNSSIKQETKLTIGGTNVCNNSSIEPEKKLMCGEDIYKDAYVVSLGEQEQCIKRGIPEYIVRSQSRKAFNRNFGSFYDICKDAFDRECNMVLDDFDRDREEREIDDIIATLDEQRYFVPDPQPLYSYAPRASQVSYNYGPTPSQASYNCSPASSQAWFYRGAPYPKRRRIG